MNKRFSGSSRPIERSGRFLGRIPAVVVGLVVAGLGSTVVGAGASEPTSAPAVAASSAAVRTVDVGEILQLTGRAKAGDVGAQAALADRYAGRQQFTEAVFWYRAAATNGEVTAQLALAGCLIAGRGVGEDRVEAAFWMRRAADGVERGGRAPGGSVSPATSQPPSVATAVPTAAVPGTAARGQAAPIIMTRSGATGAAPTKNLFTNAPANSTRGVRDDTLVESEPVLQQRSATLQGATGPAGTTGPTTVAK